MAEPTVHRCHGIALLHGHPGHLASVPPTRPDRSDRPVVTGRSQIGPMTAPWSDQPHVTCNDAMTSYQTPMAHQLQVRFHVMQLGFTEIAQADCSDLNMAPLQQGKITMAPGRAIVVHFHVCCRE